MPAILTGLPVALVMAIAIALQIGQSSEEVSLNTRPSAGRVILAWIVAFFISVGEGACWITRLRGAIAAGATRVPQT